MTAGAVSAIYISGGTFLFRQVGHFYSAVYTFVDWSDISASKILEEIVELWKNITVLKAEKVNGKKVKKKGLKDVGPISAKTKNYYLQAIKQFCKWMVQDRRATESPVKHLQSIDTVSDDPNERRALELDEMRRLLEAAQAGPDNLVSYK